MSRPITATIDAGAMRLELGHVDVAKAIAAAAEGIQDRLATDRIRLKVDVDPNIGGFIGDERRVVQVLYNLLANAVGFSPQDGTVVVSAKRTERSIVFTVTDSGPGIPPDVKDKVFDWFESRSHGSRHRGAGLGLSQESIELNQNTTAAPGPESTVARRTEKLPTPSTQGQPTSPLRARWVTWALAGSSAALLTTSGVALAVRENEASHWNDDGRCLDSANPTLTREQRCGDVRDSVKTAERVGIISGALGVGFAGAAVWHYFWSTSVKQEPGRERSAFAATCAAGLGSVVCQGRF